MMATFFHRIVELNNGAQVYIIQSNKNFNRINFVPKLINQGRNVEFYSFYGFKS